MEKQATSLTWEVCTMPRFDEVVGVPCQFIQSSHGGRMQHNALLEKKVLIASLLELFSSVVVVVSGSL